MKVLRKIVLVVLLLPIVLLVVSFFLPSKYHVVREEVILAQPEAIYPWLAQLRQWPEWTVWSTNYDPTIAHTFSGPAEGAGAVMSWTSKAGNFSLKLSAADAKTGVKYDLNYEDGTLLCHGGVTMAPVEGGQRVTFSNEGQLGRHPVRVYLGLFVDKMMGAEFQKNLQGLKQKVESKVN